MFRAVRHGGTRGMLRRHADQRGRYDGVGALTGCARTQDVNGFADASANLNERRALFVASASRVFKPQSQSANSQGFILGEGSWADTVAERI